MLTEKVFYFHLETLKPKEFPNSWMDFRFSSDVEPHFITLQIFLHVRNLPGIFKEGEKKKREKKSPSLMFSARFLRWPED